MKDKFSVTIWVIISIILATGVFALLLFVFGLWVGVMPPMTSAESFFGYFSNSIGLAVAAAGTIIAIILAYTALRSSEIQTTTVAIQEFRPEIDGFVDGANALYDETVSLFILSSEMAASGYAVSAYRTEMSMGIDGAQENLDEAFESFSRVRLLFRQNVRRLQELLMGGGNIFLRQMVEKNLECCSPELEALKSACKVHSGMHHKDTPQLFGDVNSSLSAIELLSKFASDDCLGAFSDLGHHTPEQENTSYIDQCRIEQFTQALKLGDTGKQLSPKEFSKLVSKYLPCNPSFGDYLSPSQSHSDEVTPERRLSSQIEALPSADAIDFLRDNNLNGLYAYQYILPIYLKLVDPQLGLMAMRDYFRTFGAREDILRLFIDSHAARLAYAHRTETQFLFEHKQIGEEG